MPLSLLTHKFLGEWFFLNLHKGAIFLRFPHLRAITICMYLPDLYFCFRLYTMCEPGHIPTGARADPQQTGIRTHTKYKMRKSNTKTNICGYSEQQNNLCMLHLIKLPEKQPDCCAICPLLGLIPKDRIPAKSYEKLVCLGTNEAMTQRASRIRASQRNSKHPLHRYCDNKWQIWMQLKNRCVGINATMYLQCRIPYEQSQQMTFNFIKFHRRTKTEE